MEGTVSTRNSGFSSVRIKSAESAGADCVKNKRPLARTTEDGRIVDDPRSETRPGRAYPSSHAHASNQDANQDPGAPDARLECHDATAPRREGNGRQEERAKTRQADELRLQADQVQNQGRRRTTRSRPSRRARISHRIQNGRWEGRPATASRQCKQEHPLPKSSKRPPRQSQHIMREEKKSARPRTPQNKMDTSRPTRPRNHHDAGTGLSRLQG